MEKIKNPIPPFAFVVATPIAIAKNRYNEARKEENSFEVYGCF